MVVPGHAMGVPVGFGDGLAQRGWDGLAAGAPQVGALAENVDHRRRAAVSLRAEGVDAHGMVCLSRDRPPHR